ncbi:LytTR family DNA-binding domain-containing protein [Sphingomonas sp. BGYR3]|uniref:LytR/AlgR family response regulator transcription factor n=1 Tax=Sphingomonas sp. BGYR3 TaxID=2975483 RepID=UPI0021A79F6E|nr:LytTR family DNA-binding domain-containing protein [Sphingomonas sp. BGYR3]MDG5487660.1 LytTR family DNA-binding domain-containing protein [Sphingomonas sp. BGYR3]
MAQTVRPGPESRLPIWHGYRVWAGIFAVLSAFYAIVFALTETLILPRDIALWSLCNALPHTAFAVPLVDRLAPRLPDQSPLAALVTSALAVMAYALTAYCGTVFLLAATGGVRTDGILVRFFSGPALPWQMFQGSAYGCLAIMSGLWLDARRQLLALEANQSPEPQRPQRWLVKTTDGIIPVDPADIVRIEAAGEYSRLVLPGQTIMSRIGMRECEERLASYPFLRAHRSHLVHNDAIIRAEPAGNGRLQLTLRNGDQVITSRDGARLVRERAI